MALLIAQLQVVTVTKSHEPPSGQPQIEATLDIPLSDLVAVGGAGTQLDRSEFAADRPEALAMLARSSSGSLLSLAALLFLLSVVLESELQYDPQQPGPMQN